jgi:hypothetical protein
VPETLAVYAHLTVVLNTVRNIWAYLVRWENPSTPCLGTVDPVYRGKLEFSTAKGKQLLGANGSEFVNPGEKEWN